MGISTQMASGTTTRSRAIWPPPSAHERHGPVLGVPQRVRVLYRTQGKYAEAEPLFKRSLAIWEKALGQEHPQVAVGLENYAVLLREVGRVTEANELAGVWLWTLEDSLRESNREAWVSVSNGRTLAGRDHGS